MAPRPKPAMVGPSPRVRGEPPETATAARPETGHPRACGENSFFLIDRCAARRAIPARAGRTSPTFSIRRSISGPSPRVRGERTGGSLNPAQSRAIPARAGRTETPAETLAARPGPSPRVRGERWPLGSPSRRGRRAIPARAGRTLPAETFVIVMVGPSPRVRGELQQEPNHHGYMTGHPRACGEDYATDGTAGFRPRAIPARAGRTLICFAATAGVSGPSPRVRGGLECWHAKQA